MIEYRGYTGVFEYDPDIESFHGRVVGLADVISFYGKSIDNLKSEMATSVDMYLDWCAQDGVEPGRPYSGRFNVRLDPDKHRAVAAAAAAAGRSMNDWVAETLDIAVAAAPKPTRVNREEKP